MITHSAPLGIYGLMILLLTTASPTAQTADPALKTEHFDHDPGWEGFHNHAEAAKGPRVIQDFGYCPADPTKEQTAAIGGRVTRASHPAYYAEPIPAKTLDDELKAAGTFRLAASSGGSGVFFGWFNARQRDGSGRPVNSLGLDFDGEGKGARLAVRLINENNQSCGTFITPFIPGKYRPTPIRNDGTLYRWDLRYDPHTNSGAGRVSFRIESDSPKREEFEGKWFSFDLPAGFKATGATFDRFGLMNALKPGGNLRIYFAGLQLDRQPIDLQRDPRWLGTGNRTNYDETNPAGAHDFGFSPDTSFAGGRPGEIGGKLWRSGSFAYYADRVGPLTLAQPLQASGKVILLSGAPDSDMYLGWFNSAVTNDVVGTRRSPAKPEPVFLGVHIGGPTRVGHYFQPACALPGGVRRHVKTGPVLTPEHVFDWTARYDPAENDGGGEVRVTLGGEVVSMRLRPEDRSSGVVFDRFGLFTSTIGGQMVRIYFDDLQYTAEPK